MMKITQKEFELEISRLLQYEDIEGIARNSTIGYSYVQSQLSPNDSRKSYLFGAIQTLVAAYKTRRELGEGMKRIFLSHLEAEIPCDESFANADLEAGKTVKEFSDIFSARFEGKSGLRQIGEINECIAQLRKYKDSVIAETNAEKESFDSVRNRLKVVK